jgi:fermentation-respiration switch protein FrsA (DUF1100 family)
MSEEDLQKAISINKGAYDLVVNAKSTDELKSKLTAYFMEVMMDTPDSDLPEGVSREELVQSQVMQLANPWMQYFIKYDPSIILEKVKCPVLAVNGQKDLQVPSKENLEAIKKALAKGGNKKVTTIELPGLNHLFQECTTGSPDEYAAIEQTISPSALTAMLEWMRGL